MRGPGTTIAKADRIDVRAGRHTYGQAVELGRIVGNRALSDIEAVRQVIATLHPDVGRVAINKDNMRYALEVIDAVHFWAKVQAERLKYEPSDDEKRAGFADLAAKTGVRGVAVSLGRDFGVHPDVVFGWSLASVFTILEVDLLRAKYRRNYQEIENKRRERAARNARRGRR